LTVDDDDQRSVLLRAVKGDKAVELRIFVSAVRNLIVMAGQATGLSPGDMAVRLYRHRDTIVPGGISKKKALDKTRRHPVIYRLSG